VPTQSCDFFAPLVCEEKQQFQPRLAARFMIWFGFYKMKIANKQSDTKGKSKHKPLGKGK
jgi:hypothetical protein